MKILVNFADSGRETIDAYFTCRQDDMTWERQEEIDTSDPRWLQYYNSQSVEFRQALPRPD